MRNASGQLGPALIILILLAIPVIGSIAVDTYHTYEAQRALQNAVDSAALAGAADLWFKIDEASPDAFKFAALNNVDRVPVANGSPGTTVEVVVTPPQSNKLGTVEVTATRRIRHLLAPIFGRESDVITARALAGTAGQLWMLASGQCFPVAVSIDRVPEGGVALNTTKPGDVFTINIEAKGAKNGAYTSLTRNNSGAYIKDALLDAIGLAPQPEGFIPAVKLGDSINLNNGNLGMSLITKEPGHSALLNLPYIVLPVIKGDPAYNKSASVIGFVGLRVTRVDKNKDDPSAVDSITGILVTPQVIGESGPLPTTGQSVDDIAISRLALGPIQLLR